MKKAFGLLLVCLLCAALAACATFTVTGEISFNEDGSELYYHGYTYRDADNYSGKYRVKMEYDGIVQLAEFPYGYGGNIERFYGNEVEAPAFVVNKRFEYFYVREDISLDHSYMLVVHDTEEPLCFRISEVTTGTVIPFEYEKKYEFTELCDFFAEFEVYPGLNLWITISEYNGKLYLQDVWDADYYEITDAFAEDLHQIGADRLRR